MFADPLDSFDLKGDFFCKIIVNKFAQCKYFINFTESNNNKQLEIMTNTPQEFIEKYDEQDYTTTDNVLSRVDSNIQDLWYMVSHSNINDLQDKIESVRKYLNDYRRLLRDSDRKNPLVSDRWKNEKIYQ